MSILTNLGLAFSFACLTSITLSAQEYFPPNGATLVEKRQQRVPETGHQYAVHKYRLAVSIASKTQWPVVGSFKRTGHRMTPMPMPRDMAWGNYFVKGVVVSFDGTDTSWSATLALIPTVENDVSWDFDNVQYELVRIPDKKEIVLAGSKNGKEMRGLLQPGVVYDLAVDGGRVFGLRLGDWSKPALTNPQFRTGERLSFQFTVPGLDKLPRTVSTTPTLVEGADYTNYDKIAALGGKSTTQDKLEGWSIYVFGHTETIVVAAPLASERGGEGGVAMESLGTGTASVASAPTSVPAADTGAPWTNLTQGKIGTVPKVQRATARTTTLNSME